MRFYNNKIPDIDDIVICQIKKIAKDAIYVTLLEYDNIEGMVQLANASIRRRRRSICLLKENKQYPLLVIAIDKENNYIDLSNKYLSDEDKENATNKYNLYHKVIKLFNNFMCNIYDKDYTDEQYIEYAKKTIWKIDKYKCYEYLIDKYYNNLDLDVFDVNLEDKNKIKELMIKHFGIFKISSKLLFMLRNPNYGGINNIITLFDNICLKYNCTINIDVVPMYTITIESNSKNNNEDYLENIHKSLKYESNDKKMFYTKKKIITNII